MDSWVGAALYDVLFETRYGVEIVRTLDKLSLGVIVDTSASMFLAGDISPDVANIQASVWFALNFASYYSRMGVDVDEIVGFFTGESYDEVARKGYGNARELVKLLSGEKETMDRNVYVLYDGEVDVVADKYRAAMKISTRGIPVVTGGTLLDPVLTYAQEVAKKTIGNIDLLFVFTDGEIGDDELHIYRDILNPKMVYILTTQDPKNTLVYTTTRCVLLASTNNPTPIRTEPCRTMLRIYRATQFIEVTKPQ